MRPSAGRASCRPRSPSVSFTGLGNTTNSNAGPSLPRPVVGVRPVAVQAKRQGAGHLQHRNGPLLHLRGIEQQHLAPPAPRVEGNSHQPPVILVAGARAGDELGLGHDGLVGALPARDNTRVGVDLGGGDRGGGRVELEAVDVAVVVGLVAVVDARQLQVPERQ
jgi:hypothetical protein